MSSTNLKIKKKLAPQSRKPKTQEPKGTAGEENDDFEFSDDLLEEVFSDQPERTMASATIDLDDWIPKKLMKAKDVSTVSSLPLMPVKGNCINSTTQATTKYIKSEPSNKVSRVDAMFTSKEYLEDSTLRLRFLKRSVPASRLKTLTESKQLVPLPEALKFTGKNWFTFGVISEFGILQKGGSGRIDVTDLSAEPYVLRFLLFNSAFNIEDKIPVGSIVCLLNPTKAKPFNGKEALVLNDAAQILIAGTSRDFGLCSGKRKAGGSCSAVVNMNICRYCKYHAVTEFKQQKMAKDLKAAALGAGVGSHNSIRPGLWNAQASLASSINPAKKNILQMKKDRDRLDKLNSISSTSTGPAESKSGLSSLPFVGSFSKDDPTNSPMFARRTGVDKRKSNCMSPDQTDSTHQIKKPAMLSNSISSSHSPLPKMSSAKKKALQFVRDNGGISKEKSKPKFESAKEDNKAPLGITDEFLAIMKEKPRDAALLESAEALERDKRFERLQVVEEISEKLAATHEVPVRAIRCLVCKKNYHQMPLQCVMNKHSCRVITGTKRFYECNGCRARTTTLERLPAAECSKCGVWSWKKAGVAVNRTCTTAPQLSVRGMEEKFVGSIVKEPNLSLLVPDKE